MNEQMKDDIILAIIFVIVGFTFTICFLKFWHYPLLAEHSFCESKGFDGSSFFGRYSEKYGKVECVSCYKDECTYKEFDVTRNWIGSLKEVSK